MSVVGVIPARLASTRLLHERDLRRALEEIRAGRFDAAFDAAPERVGRLRGSRAAVNRA